MKKPFQRIAALTLSAALALGCCGGALAADADESGTDIPSIGDTENTQSSSETKIVESQYDYYCMKDATLEEMKAKLPSEVTITLSTGDTETLQNANWEQDTEDPYLGNGYNADYRFKLVLPDGYKYRYDYSWCGILVEFYDCTDATGIAEPYYEDLSLASDSNTIEALTAEVNAAYPELTVKTNDGEFKKIPVTWSADPVDEKDYLAGNTTAIEFELNLPDGYRIVGSADFDTDVWVHTSRRFNSDTFCVQEFSTKTYTTKVMNATAATALQSLPSEVEVTLSNGKAIKIPAKWEQVQSDNDANFEFKFVFPEGYTALNTRTVIPNVLVYNTVTEPETPTTPGTGSTGDAAASGNSTVTATSTTTATGTTSTTAKSDAKKTKSPKTADESHALLAASTLALSAAALTCAVVVNKKRKDA